MQLTLQDFRDMIAQCLIDSGLAGTHNGVKGRLREVYGSIFSETGRYDGSCALTEAGVDEYVRVKEWISARATTDLVPYHAIERPSPGGSVWRRIPLVVYKNRTSPTEGPVAPAELADADAQALLSANDPITPEERRAMRANAYAVSSPERPSLTSTMAGIQRNAVLVFLREALEQLYVREDISEEAKAIIAEALAIAESSLATLV